MAKDVEGSQCGTF